MPEVDRRAENWDDFQISNLEILLALHSMDRLPRTGPRLSCELLDLVRAGRGRGIDGRRPRPPTSLAALGTRRTRTRGMPLPFESADRSGRHVGATGGNTPGARARRGRRCRSRAPTVCLDVARAGALPRSPSLPAAAVAPAEGGEKRWTMRRRIERAKNGPKNSDRGVDDR